MTSRTHESDPDGAGLSTPLASSPAARRRMLSTRRRDTAPELALRRALHRRGMRYRVEVKLPELPRRRMDIVFLRRRLVVLVDGCFWHGCPLHGTAAMANSKFWANKIASNQARDADTTRVLQDAGWRVLRVWEHEPPSDVADRIQRYLESQEEHGLPRDAS